MRLFSIFFVVALIFSYCGCGDKASVNVVNLVNYPDAGVSLPDAYAGDMGVDSIDSISEAPDTSEDTKVKDKGTDVSGSADVGGNDVVVDSGNNDVVNEVSADAGGSGDIGGDTTVQSQDVGAQDQDDEGNVEKECPAVEGPVVFANVTVGRKDDYVYIKGVPCDVEVFNSACFWNKIGSSTEVTCVGYNEEEGVREFAIKGKYFNFRCGSDCWMLVDGKFKIPKLENGVDYYADPLGMGWGLMIK